MLASLLGRPGEVSRIAAGLADTESARLWLWLARHAADAVRSVATGTPPDWLPRLERTALRSLARLQQEADRNRRFAASTVRQDLLLQEWLIKWAAMAS